MIERTSTAAKSGTGNMDASIHTTLYEMVAAVSDQLSPNEQSLTGPVVLDLLVKSHYRLPAIGQPSQRRLPA